MYNEISYSSVHKIKQRRAQYIRVQNSIIQYSKTEQSGV